MDLSKRPYLTSLLFVIIFCCSTALQAASSPEFWKLTRSGQTIWLLGSVHIADSSFYPFPQSINTAFNQANDIYLEVDLAKLTNKEIIDGMSMTRLPSGNLISSVLTKQSYQKLKQILATYHLPLSTYQSYKPWFTAIILSQALTEKLGYQSKFGIDNYFSDLARKQNKNLIQFESFTDQMKLLAEVEPHQQIIFDETLKQIPELKSTLEKIMASWRKGDSAALETLLSEHSGSLEIQQWMQETLLIKRNLKWFTQLERQKPQSAFIVVGALHILGKKGLLNLLKSAGFKAQVVN